MSNYKSNSKTFPIIPLQISVAFPNTTFVLDDINGFAATAIAEASIHHTPVILVAQNDDEKPTDSHISLYTIGVLAEIDSINNKPNFRKNIVFNCKEKVEIHKYTVDHDQTLYGDVTIIDPESVLDEEFVKNQFVILSKIFKDGTSLNINEIKKCYQAIGSKRGYTNTCDYIASTLLTNQKKKIEILIANTPDDKIKLLVPSVKEELALLELQEKIDNEVQIKLDENQKEFYLREQMHAIQEELGASDDDEYNEFREKIAKDYIPKEVQEKLNKELSRLEKAPFGSPDAALIRNYIESCLSIPFGNYTETKDVDIEQAKQVLDSDHYGLDKLKTRILEYIAIQKITNQTTSQILCLIGPPGVGKTSIAYSIAKAMNRSVQRVSLGGLRDEADIRGHRKTYVGAMPGRIVEGITNAKTMNPVIILDEIDKLSQSYNGDPSSALLEVLDPEQNKSFRDHYIEFPLDLSKCVFIATANNYSSIPSPLLDRMEIIELNSYTDVEKYHIAKNHLIPKQMKANGLKKSQLSFSKDGIEVLIKKYAREAGVRELDRKIASLCRKVAYDLVTNKFESIKLDEHLVEEYLGNSYYYNDNLNHVDTVGVVNGLAYTSIGGDVLNVQVLINKGQGKLETTGSLGDVMKESATICLNYIRSIADKLQINEDFYKETDIHIHFPDGSTPKDGPSAGITMTCALISALTGAKPDHLVAMTGEMTLTGQILPIGGLKEKTMAAYKEGIKKVLIPKANEKDLEDIDQTARKHLEFVLCENIFDALPHLFHDTSKVLKK